MNIFYSRFFVIFMAEIGTKVKKISLFPPLMMPVNKEILKDEIQWLMEAINEQFNAIISYEGKIPQIEFDIIMENVRKFYENLHMLQRSDDPYAYFEEKVREVPVIKTMVPRMEAVAKEPESGPTDPPEPGSEIRIDGNEPDAFPDGQVESNESTPFKIRHHGDAVEVDLFSDTGSGFTEKLKEAREKSLGPRPVASASGDLKASISINEKFLLINELFSGNLREYNEMIDSLNGYHDLRTALEYLDLLRKKNLWDTGSAVFVRLKELVEKRFA
jgi:hypothetical protein